MRILAFSNYDIGGIHKLWNEEKQEAPSQHMWGGVQLSERGHDVVYLDFEQSKWLKWLYGKLRMVGDLGLQLDVKRKARNFDAVYCAHQPTVALLSLFRRIGLFRKPLVAVGYQTPRSNGFVARTYAKLFINGLDRLLCMSDEMEADLGRLGVKKAKMGQIRWGVDMKYYPFGETAEADVPHFLSVGKTFRDFGALISGFPFDRARLTVFGAGHELNVPIPTEADGRLEIRSDWMEWREYVQLLPGFHAMVLPIDMKASNANNAIGLTAVTEALIAGLPVISTDNRYIGIDLAGDGIGYWVEPGSSDAWSAAISKCCDDLETLHAMRRKARDVAETRINIQAFADVLEAELQGVVNAPRS